MRFQGTFNSSWMLTLNARTDLQWRHCWAQLFFAYHVQKMFHWHDGCSIGCSIPWIHWQQKWMELRYFHGCSIDMLDCSWVTIGCLKGNHFRKAHVFGNEIWGPFTLFLEPNLRLGAFTAACLKNVKLLGKSWKWNSNQLQLWVLYKTVQGIHPYLGPIFVPTGWERRDHVIWSHHHFEASQATTIHYSGARMLQAPKHIQNTEFSRGTKHGLGGGSSRHHLFVKGIPSTSTTGGC